MEYCVHQGPGWKHMVTSSRVIEESIEKDSLLTMCEEGWKKPARSDGEVPCGGVET